MSRLNLKKMKWMFLAILCTSCTVHPKRYCMDFAMYSDSTLCTSIVNDSITSIFKNLERYVVNYNQKIQKTQLE